MELKEYLQIIQKNIKLFLVIIFGVVVVTISYFYFQPITYETSLTLNITRLGTQETADYRYDDFYRLQADERFSDTVSEWLRSPRIAKEILESAKIGTADFSLKKLAKTLKAQRKTSQIVDVNFTAFSEEKAQMISTGIVKAVSQNTGKLNANQKEISWFQIVPEKPVIVERETDYGLIFLAAFLMGIFLAFWSVMTKHYLE